MIINTKLEQEFDLMPIIEESDESLELVPVTDDPITQIAGLDKIDAALPRVYGLDASDNEFDALAEMAVKAHKDLMELAMNVDYKNAGEISSTAASMLGHAIAAKTNKIKKKLDMISLQLKKQALDMKNTTPDENQVTGEGHVMDRNELLAKLKSGEI
jgi:hypothetical protein